MIRDLTSLRPDSRSAPKFFYSAYGIEIRSNAAIAALEGTAVSGSPLARLALNFHSRPSASSSPESDELRYTSEYRDARGVPALKIFNTDGGAFVRMAYSDGTEFWINRQLDSMWIDWPEDQSFENAADYFIGPALGVYLRLCGIVCLHGSVVEIAGSAIIFAGAPGAGKSTTAAAFAKRGNAVLADDIAALVQQAGAFRVLPGYPRVNLWPNSVQLLYGSPEALPLIHRSGSVVEEAEKRFLRLGAEGETPFAQSSLPLGAIYLLQPPDRDQAGGAVRVIESVSKQAAMMSLVANTYGSNMLDVQQRAKEFAELSRLVESVPVRNVYARRNGLGLGALCELISEDMAELRVSAHNRH